MVQARKTASLWKLILDDCVKTDDVSLLKVSNQLKQVKPHAVSSPTEWR